MSQQLIGDNQCPGCRIEGNFIPVPDPPRKLRCINDTCKVDTFYLKIEKQARGMGP